MARSFRLRIALLTLCFSGLMLVAFGLYAVSALNRVGIERIDRELRALADTQVRREQPPDHWQRFDESFRSMYGTDESKQFIVKATRQHDRTLHATADWPAGLSPDALPLPMNTPPQAPTVRLPEAKETLPVEKELRHLLPYTQPPFPPREMSVLDPVYATLKGSGTSWRAITMANEEVTLSIAINLAELHAEISRFRKALFIGIPLGLLLLAICGWFIGHLALRPVNRIARTTQAITIRHLDARIEDHNVDKEFRHLIDVINGMLERLDRSFHQATRFSGDAAHELKTPLAILQAQLEGSLQRAKDASPEQREYAEQLDEVQRLKGILQKLLLLSQTDAGQLAISTEPFNLANLIRSAASDVEFLAPDRKTAVDAPTELLVPGDADLVKQIIENLVSNAVKFGQAEGTIHIKVEQSGNNAAVTVTNNGPAIPSQDAEHIFERFYRVDPSRSRKTEGAGLGLSLARELAKAHGGELTLAQSDGHLTRFVLVLPRQ